MIKHISNKLHFQIIRVIAEVRMGVVYEAKQNETDQFVKRVAIKLIREEYLKTDEFRANSIGEARLVASLINTNSVQAYHLGEIGGLYFMTMEYVDDINPKNIILQKGCDVKVTDFEIAKAAELMYIKKGEVIRDKDLYLLPEQARRKVTDARADLFACRISLSEMLLGEKIFEDQNMTQRPEPTSSKSLYPNSERSVQTSIHDPRKSSKRASLGYRDARYRRSEMLYYLERYLYDSEYDPTNEKLATYMSGLFSPDGANAVESWKNGITPGLN